MRNCWVNKIMSSSFTWYNSWTWNMLIQFKLVLSTIWMDSCNRRMWYLVRKWCFSSKDFSGLPNIPLLHILDKKDDMTVQIVVEIFRINPPFTQDYKMVLRSVHILSLRCYLNCDLWLLLWPRWSFAGVEPW